MLLELKKENTFGCSFIHFESVDVNWAEEEPVEACIWPSFKS